MNWWKNRLITFFLDCPFARMCWDIISIDIPLNSNFPEICSTMRAQLDSQFFMEAIVLMCWTIWSARNDLIFKGISLILANCRNIFFRELMLLQHRVKPGQENLLFSWIQSMV